jgi:hypothetical protein
MLKEVVNEGVGEKRRTDMKTVVSAEDAFICGKDEMKLKRN